jgi:hypothetical protein
LLLFFFNFSLLLIDYYLYLVKKRVFNEASIQDYKEIEESSNKQRESKKSKQFDLDALGLFNEYKGKFHKYKKKTRFENEDLSPRQRLELEERVSKEEEERRRKQQY